MVDSRGPGIKFPPPFLFVAGLGVAWLLEKYVRRFPISAPGESQAVGIAGAFLGALGLLVIFWAMLTFFQARTAILPMRAASRLVETGPYRLSRNPMYTGLSLLYLGAMFVTGWGWALVLFPIVLGSLYRFVIAKEERHLHALFGEEYQAYCRRVRRWI